MLAEHGSGKRRLRRLLLRKFPRRRLSGGCRPFPHHWLLLSVNVGRKWLCEKTVSAAVMWKFSWQRLNGEYRLFPHRQFAANERWPKAAPGKTVSTTGYGLIEVSLAALAYGERLSSAVAFLRSPWALYGRVFCQTAFLRAAATAFCQARRRMRNRA